VRGGVYKKQEEEASMAAILWRKKLVLHGMRVDDLVGYSQNPMAPPPDDKVGFVSASSARGTVAGEAGRPVVSSTSDLRCGPSGMRLGL